MERLRQLIHEMHRRGVLTLKQRRLIPGAVLTASLPPGDLWDKAKASQIGSTLVLLAAVLFVQPRPVASQDTERLYQEACDDGNMDACNVLGLMFEAGRGVPRDLARAALLYERACDGGEVAGCTNLGVSYEVGAGVPQDTERAVDLYQLACGGGDGAACTNLEGLRQTGLEAPGRIVGRVVEEGGGRGISDVDVAVSGQSQVRTLSNGQGRFDLRDLQPGLVEVRFDRLGYAPRDATLVVGPGRTVEVLATMSAEPIELEPIEVTVRSTYLERNGFYRRAERGSGQHFDRRALDAIAPVLMADVVRRVPGVTVRYADVGGETQALSYRAGGLRNGPCVLPVYLDGIRTFGTDIEVVLPDNVEAVEVYNGLGIPIEYAGLNACGLVLIWTR